MQQRDTMPCRHCGGIMALTPTPSPYEFDAVCDCGRYLVSWAHKNDPPQFVQQGRLPLDRSGLVVE